MRLGGLGGIDARVRIRISNIVIKRRRFWGGWDDTSLETKGSADARVFSSLVAMQVCRNPHPPLLPTPLLVSFFYFKNSKHPFSFAYFGLFKAGY